MSSSKKQKPPDLNELLKGMEAPTLCSRCEWFNTDRCPSYDFPKRRTSLRMQYCNAGKPRKSD